MATEKSIHSERRGQMPMMPNLWLFQLPRPRRVRSLSYNPFMIAQELLEILVCPACKQALEYRQTPESLRCVQCRLVYAVKDDIPIMLIDQATIESA